MNIGSQIGTNGPLWCWMLILEEPVGWGQEGVRVYENSLYFVQFCCSKIDLKFKIDF